MADTILSKLLSDEIVSAAWDFDTVSQDGGASLAGGVQVAVLPAARWTCTLTINVFTRSDDLSALAYRALKSKLRGRDRSILIPDIEKRGPSYLAGLLDPIVPYSDGAFHSDGSGFRQGLEGVILVGDHMMNATTVTFSTREGLLFLPGQRFSMPDGRMHEISDILAVGSGSITVEIFPWFREDYASGISLDFSNPACIMRLAKDQTGILTVSATPVSVPTIEFVEYF